MLAGVAAAREAGLQPVKINTVLLRGINDHEAFELLQWAMAEQVQLRFIEQMPLDPQHGWKRDEMITADEIRQRLGQHVELVEDPEDALARGSAPAELFRVAGTSYRVGIIASVSKPFCGSCDRVRLTADGQDQELPLRPHRVRPAYAAAYRRKRGRDCRPLGSRCCWQATRPRHQRPQLPAAGSAHVRHWRLEAASAQSQLGNFQEPAR